MGNLLAMKAFKEIPSPSDNASNIVGLVKQKGKIIGYKLSNNQIIDKQMALSMARNGQIKGVGIATRNGKEYLKSLPDGSENNNLGSLPSISM